MIGRIRSQKNPRINAKKVLLTDMLIRYFTKAVLLAAILVVSSALLEASYSLIVLGDFSKEQSESLCRQLSSMGYPVYIVYGENYEVRVGPYETREKAQKVLETLDQDEKIDTKIFEEEDLEQYTAPADEDTQEKEAVGRVVNEGTKSSYTDERANKIITLALDLFGHPYKYGGENLNKGGIDCSYFTQSIFKELGITLPRTAAGQFKTGMKVKKKEQLKVGDLVFFRKTYYSKRKNKKGKRRAYTKINHVGIYIGNGEFIHDTINVKHVTISPLDDPYFKKRYAGARRVLSD